MTIQPETISFTNSTSKNSIISIRELIGRILRLNASKNNIDVAITSEKSKKTIIVTETNERSIFKLGQFFKQQRYRQIFSNNNVKKVRWEQLLEIEKLHQLGANIYCSNISSKQKTYTIEFSE